MNWDELEKHRHELGHLAGLRITQEQMASVLGCARSTYNTWRPNARGGGVVPGAVSAHVVTLMRMPRMQLKLRFRDACGGEQKPNA